MRKLFLTAVFFTTIVLANAQYMVNKSPKIEQVPMAFISLISSKQTERIVKIKPNDFKGQPGETYRFSTDEKAQRFITEGFYEIELPKLFFKERIVVKVMVEDYIVDEKTYTASDNPIFTIELFQNQTLQFVLN